MKVLFLNHKQQQCGVYQYGYRSSNILQKEQKYDFIYTEIENQEEYFNILSKEDFRAIIYNYHPLTMPWLNKSHLDNNRSVKHLCIHHEGSKHDGIGFDFYLMANSTFIDTSTEFAIPRPLFEGITFEKPHNYLPVISSFGFGFGNKGFGRVVKAVNDEFDEAIIRLHIPRAFFGDKDGQATASILPGCFSELKKPGISLELTHNFLTDQELLKFLSQSDLNIFLYDEMLGRGLSSVIDYALSVDTPIAINKTYMFKHIYNASPSICVEDSSLKDIIFRGDAPLRPFKSLYSHSNFIKKYESILDNVL